MSRVLLVGMPRCGSTWAVDVLSLAEGASVVGEPDNPGLDPTALEARVARGWHPLIAVGESAPDYERVWDLAFAGGWPTNPGVRAAGRAFRRLPRPVVDPLVRGLAPVMTRFRSRPDYVVAKSVYATFAVEWIADRYGPKIVVLERHLLDVVASWLELDMQIGDLEYGDAAKRMVKVLGMPPPTPGAERHRRVAWAIGFLSVAMKRTAARHPEWLCVTHEELIADPVREFSRLYAALGLRWTNEAEARILESDRPGTGFELSRVRSELKDSWRRRLTSTQAADVQAVLASFTSN